MPFAQPLAHFPVSKRPRLAPSFLDKHEVCNVLSMAGCCLLPRAFACASDEMRAARGALPGALWHGPPCDRIMQQQWCMSSEAPFSPCQSMSIAV